MHGNIPARQSDVGIAANSRLVIISKTSAFALMYGGPRTSSRRSTKQIANPFGQKRIGRRRDVWRERLARESLRGLGSVLPRGASTIKDYTHLTPPGYELEPCELVVAIPPRIKIKPPIVLDLPWDDWSSDVIKSSTILDGMYRLYWNVPLDTYSIKHHFSITVDWSALDLFEAQAVVVQLCKEREDYLNDRREYTTSVIHDEKVYFSK
jgi:hypothetical protein